MAKRCTRGSPLVLALVALLLFPIAALAHPVPRRAHDRTIRVTLTADAVVVSYRLEIDLLTVMLDDLPAVCTEEELLRFSKPNEFYDAFVRGYDRILADHLQAKLDGKALVFAPVERGYSLVDEDGRPLDHLRCDFVFRAPWQPKPLEKHRFTLREGNYELEAGKIVLSLAAQAPVVLHDKVEPAKALQEKSSRDLQPGDDAKLRTVSAEFASTKIFPAEPAKTVDDPVASAEEATEVAPDDRASNAPTRLFELLLDTQRGFVVLLLLAAGIGGAHALTPGHGKTLVAAYLVGERGTVYHAFLLGWVTTITHTGSVLVLAAGLTLYYPRTVPADVQAALGFLGGLLVSGMGFWLLLRRLTGGADHFHLGGHSHHHHHPQKGDAPATSIWRLILLGISGGIVPCWDAIIMLCFAISAQRLALALPLLLAFSAGLAAVLISIGIGVVALKGVAGNRWSGSRWFRALPIISAALVTALGLWLCYDSINGNVEEPEPPSAPSRS